MDGLTSASRCISKYARFFQSSPATVLSGLYHSEVRGATSDLRISHFTQRPTSSSASITRSIGTFNWFWDGLSSVSVASTCARLQLFQRRELFTICCVALIVARHVFSTRASACDRISAFAAFDGYRFVFLLRFRPSDSKACRLHCPHGDHGIWLK